MNPRASSPVAAGAPGGRGLAWPMAIAIMFALVAAVSFALDQSVTLSSLPAPPPSSDGR